MIMVDTTPPDVSINQSTTQLDPTNDPIFEFTVIFSEAIDPATLTSGDFTLGGTGTGGTV